MLYRLIFFTLFALLGLSVLCLFFIALLPLAADAVAQAYAFFPERPGPQYTSFLNAMGAIVASISVIAALITFALSTRSARRAQRKQHTITVLLDTRLSSEFQGTIEKRRYIFPEYTDVSFDAWNAARTATASNPNDPDEVAEAKRRRDSALAVTQLLNYYEFLAVGITEGDLDEAMLKKTVRSIMCNLVDDARNLIATMQNTSKPGTTYEHLTALYNDWRKPGAIDINGNPNERPIPKL